MTISEVTCSQYIVHMCRVNPYFKPANFMAQNKSLHLCIDDRILLILISMLPV